MLVHIHHFHGCPVHHKPEVWVRKADEQAEKEVEVYREIYTKFGLVLERGNEK